MMRTAFLIVAVALLAATPVSGQAPAPSPVAPAATTTPAPVPNASPALEPQGYDYNPAGRRDPFISLIRRTTAVSGVSAHSRPTGIAGLSSDEITMRGVVKGRDGWKAIVKGADNRTYTVKAGEQLYDGTVRAVTADAMFILQDVNDPLSTQKKREVKKLLRPEQEAQ
jgi:type IV pilus assembly protein PilP